MKTQSIELNNRYQQLRSEQPKIRARDAAEALGVSEGELLASRVGQDATRLIDDVETILRSVLPLGEVMALTRNESCVHERKGVYDNAQFFHHGKMSMGLFVNPDIDLRLFMSHWKFSFAATEQTRGGPRKSLQFFDKEGTALHKIYLTPKSHEENYDALVQKLCHENQDTWIETLPYQKTSSYKPDEEVDWPAFRTAWKNIKDTHDFYPLLQKFKIDREQAFENIGREYAYRVKNGSARRVLDFASDRECEIMVFVGNRGCLQIHTGPVKKLFEYGTWYNVMDPLFNLHLREDHISSVWVTKKPTVDGIVTALEIFDSQGGIIATFFGKRKPGIPELALWREIVDQISVEEAVYAN